MPQKISLCPEVTLQTTGSDHATTSLPEQPWAYPERKTPAQLLSLAQHLNSNPEDRRLREFLHQHRRFLGASLLRVLLRNPGREYSAGQLWDLLHGRPGSQSGFSGDEPFLLETAVRSCDTRTLRQVRARHKQLSQTLATDALSPSAKENARHELDQLEQYLRASVAPGGAIRALLPTRQRAQRSLAAALSRLLAVAACEDPALADRLRSGLRCGRTFVWLGGDSSRPAQPLSAEKVGSAR